MTDDPAPADACAVPVDPSFSGSAYEGMALLLRAGFLAFLALASIGTSLLLLRHGSESVGVLYATNPRSVYWTVQEYFAHLDDYSDRALILLGLAAMIAANFGRVLVSSVYLARGRERSLAALSVLVVGVIILALLVARYPV